MSPILALPRELRDKILAMVVTTPLQAPRNPSEADPTHREELRDLLYQSWFGDKDVQNTPQVNRTDLLPILLVNRQLYAETLDAIDVFRNNLKYDLDVMLVDEVQLWPTWLCVPALSSRVNTVNCTMRIFGGPKGRSGFQGADGGPPRITWTFYNLLERFLRVGPVGWQSDREMDNRISLKHLVLNIETPDVGSGKLLPPYEHRFCEFRRLRRDSDIEYIMHPKFLETFISSAIENLLTMSYYTADYGGMLYERIGTIQLSVDGGKTKEWDLAKLLSELKGDEAFANSYREDRPRKFQEWKQNAYKTRVELGLHVVPIPATGNSSCNGYTQGI